MKVLVLAQSYPDNSGCVELTYIHTRNLYYHEYGIDVTVLNFKAEKGYVIDNIPVISVNEYEQNKHSYDLLIIHAANIRNHFHFLKKHGDEFSRFIFFYHGHEVMRINHDYAAPYAYKKLSPFEYIFQEIYDIVKLFVWKRYIPQIVNKSHFIFVSKWMLDIFEKNIGLSANELYGKYSITYNSVGKKFEQLSYDTTIPKEYDFVTVRANLDGSKYAVDIVNRLAQNTPNGRFLVVGKGELFSHIEKAANVTWINDTMNHEGIVNVLNKSKYALMPTRTDAQGLMMCEMAAFGIPVITSDIDVCHEVFDGFKNVYFISNDDINVNLNTFLGKESHCMKDSRYYCINTINRELEIIQTKAGK